MLVFNMWAGDISVGRKIDNFLKLLVEKKIPCVPTIILLEKSVQMYFKYMGCMWKMMLYLHYKYLITQKLLTI